jgi:hypothetical protein
VLNKAELDRTGRPEPAGHTRALATVAGDRSGVRRRLLIGAALVCAVGLAAWIGVLAVTLPWRYRAGGWSAAWVGFDGVLFLAFAATAWAAWRRRQILILCLIVVAILLCCDAWFDTTLDWGTPGFTASLTLALLVELPLAVLAVIGARRLLRLTFSRLDALRGNTGPVPPFWKVPLFGDYSAGEGYRDLFYPPQGRPDGACLAEAKPDGATSAQAEPGGPVPAGGKPDGSAPAGAKPDESAPAGAKPDEAAPGPGDRAA